MEKIRISLVGCGRISKNHFEAIGELSDTVELVSVCDAIEERAASAGKQYGVPWYTNYQQMLDSVPCDLVSICTPSGLHPQHGAMAAEKKYHVLSEKPMGTDLRSADRLIKACDDNGVQLFVVKQNRLNKTVQLVKNAIEKGRFGKIYFSTVNVFWTRPQEYYDHAKWRGTWEFDGGAFMNQASHYVDLMSWLLGPIDSVSAFTGTLERRIEAEDTGVAALRFRNGAMGSINVTMLTYPKNYEGSITIIGEKGTVKIGGIALNKVEHWEFKDYDDDDALIFESNYNPPNVYGFGHANYYHNVIDTLNGNCPADTDGRSGRKSLEIILAIYKSAKEGRYISLPLEY